MLEPSWTGAIIFQKYLDEAQTNSDRLGVGPEKSSDLDRASQNFQTSDRSPAAGLGQDQQNSEQPIGSGCPWISEPDCDLIGPKMNIQDAIKIKLLRWENEFERVEHF